MMLKPRNIKKLKILGSVKLMADLVPVKNRRLKIIDTYPLAVLEVASLLSWQHYPLFQQPLLA